MRAVRALEKFGFRITHQGKHIKMSGGNHTVMTPRRNPVSAFTLGNLVLVAGLSVEQFRELL